MAVVEAMAILDHPAGPHPPSHGAGGGNAGAGLPDRTPLTLAEVVSWLAWGRAFACDAFRSANTRDYLRETVDGLEAAGGTHEALPRYRDELSRSEAARVEIQQAAGGAEYGSADFDAQLAAAGTKLFEAIKARRLTAR